MVGTSEFADMGSGKAQARRRKSPMRRAKLEHDQIVSLAPALGWANRRGGEAVRGAGAVGVRDAAPARVPGRGVLARREPWKAC